MKIKLTLILLIVIGLMSFSLDQFIEFDSPNHFPVPRYDFSENPLTKAQIQLGRALFYDPVLSQDNSISCASCHSPYNAFAHTDHELSHGIHDSIGIRNAPALFNLAWQESFMWDGAIHHLDMQALAPIEHTGEMAQSLDSLMEKLQQSAIYQDLFAQAYQDSVISTEHMLKAMSQFQLTLVSADSKYDKVMVGRDTFSAQEANGYELFKTHCASCHREPLFTNYEFENNGLSVDTILNDIGRMKVTRDKRDSLKFKVPSLRNLEYSYPYMHDGRFKSLTEVIEHYTDDIQNSKTLSLLLRDGVVLSANEKVDLTSFLLTLNDKDFVFNKSHQYPREIFFPSTN